MEPAYAARSTAGCCWVGQRSGAHNAGRYLRKARPGHPGRLPQEFLCARGDLGQARSCHQQALELAREVGSPLDEAHALAGLSRCDLASGRTAEAEARLRQALAIFQRIGAAETADVSAELDAVSRRRPAG